MKDHYVVTIRPRRVLAVMGLALAVVLALGGATYLLRAPILTWIGAQLVYTDPMSPADAIVVLAGGSPERELAAVDLYAAGFARRIVLTREPEPPALEILQQRGVRLPRNIDERQRYLRELGVATEHITVLDRMIQSTIDETDVVSRWAGGAGATRLILVTSPFHTSRARFIFERAFAGTGIRLLYHAAAADEFRPETWWQNRVSLRNGLIEWQKAIFYRVWYR